MDKKKLKWIVSVLVIVILTNTITYVVISSNPVFLPDGKVVVEGKDYDEFKKFSKMLQVKSALYGSFDGELKEKDVIDGAIKGVASGAKDKYTYYMNEEDYSDFIKDISGEYTGVGIRNELKDGKIYVNEVFEGSPAEKAGIKKKDILSKVDGTEINGDLKKAAELMKGKEGVEVSINVYRENKGYIDFKVKRGKVNVPTVKADMIRDNIAYIKVSEFDENTSEAFKKQLDTLKKQGMKGAIIDLRENGGGILEESVNMVSNFLQKGKTVVSTKGKFSAEKIYKSKGGDYISLPIVLLVNGESASASEIFTGAIRDYKLGTIIGQKTFGKGIAQNTKPFGDGTALKVTTSRYFTPSGENIHKKGIMPDIEVKYDKSIDDDDYLREKDTQLNKGIEVLTEKIGK